MRNILLATILLFSTISYAFNIEGVGNRTFIDNNGDTLYIFESNPEFKSNIGAIDWYRLPDTIAPFTSGTDYLYPEHGQGYAVKINGQWQCFWAFEYDSLRAQVDRVNVQQSCTQTTLLIQGLVPAIEYTDMAGSKQSVTRLCRVSYMDAMWGEDSWVDSLVVVDRELTNSIVVDASPVHTNYIITDLLAQELSLSDSIVTDIYQPMAIKVHPLAIVTTRGKDGDRSNEVERPTEPDNLVRRSAPLRAASDTACWCAG